MKQTISNDDTYERVRAYARNRAADNGRDPDLAADLAELAYAQNNEQSIAAAVEAAAGPYTRKPKPLSLAAVEKMFDERFKR